jgi:hypothetical protein
MLLHITMDADKKFFEAKKVIIYLISRLKK